MHPVLAELNPFKAPPCARDPLALERELLEGLYAVVEQIGRDRLPAFLARPSTRYLEMLATTSA